ncbi:MAG: hypothetical protein J5529_13085 [Prevotella sp.]|nr:hypothetical protein [Prevotella sp.]
MSIFSLKRINGGILAIYVCLSLMSCRNVSDHYILPNFLERVLNYETNSNIDDFSINIITHRPSSFSFFWVDLSFESDSCFEINEHDICATIGKDTLKIHSWALFFNKDNTYNGKLLRTPSFGRYDSWDSIYFPMVPQLKVPMGKNTLRFGTHQYHPFSLPLRISVILSGVQTTPVVLELKPEKAIMYSQDIKLVKWDETKIICENDSVNVYLSRQPLKKDSCEFLCLLYFDMLDNVILNKGKTVENKKELPISYIDFNLDDIDLRLSDTSYCVEVLDDIPFDFFNPFISKKESLSQACIPFKIRRKDGRPVDYIPDLILPPGNLLLKDGKPLLVDTIVFKGTLSPIITP